MFVHRIFRALIKFFAPGPSNESILLAVNQLKENMSDALANIKREIAELTEAQQAVVALVNTNTTALAQARADLAAALDKIALDEAQLAEFDGIAAQLDAVEQGLRAVLPAAPTEPTTPVEPSEPETPGTPETPETPVDGGGTPVETPVDPQPELPSEPGTQEPETPPVDTPADGGDEGQVSPQLPTQAP